MGDGSDGLGRKNGRAPLTIRLLLTAVTNRLLTC